MSRNYTLSKFQLHYEETELPAYMKDFRKRQAVKKRLATLKAKAKIKNLNPRLSSY